VQQRDPHFAPYIWVSDVVTFSTPHGAITADQMVEQSFLCAGCYQAAEMHQGSALMNDIEAHDHPDANLGTDWTLIGSLSSDDPLDWDYQATRMSNTSGHSNNHRIGYAQAIPACQGQPGWPNGYDHGDYVNDPCDGYDARYWYCDGCSRTKHSNFSYSAEVPHSLHEMMLAFFYVNW
jgi:hypothetical protein